MTINGHFDEASATGPATTGMSDSVNRRRRELNSRRLRAGLPGLVLVTPAFVFYAAFVLRPLLSTFQYSFYSWDGITAAEWVGWGNYARLFTDPDLLGPIVNAIKLIVFFSAVPVVVGLVSAAVIRKFWTSKLAIASRTVLFLPQVIPLVAAGIMWTWLMATDGVINQTLKTLGLDALARPWLADTGTALPAVGIIGAWVNVGLCMLLLLAGMTKIDPSLYEAARIDGAGSVREFRSITIPAIRPELGIAITITVISALRSFDIIYISTQGGPGNATLVPGLEIYYLAFFERQIGQASAMAVVLTLLVLAVVIPLNRIGRTGNEL